MRLIEKITLLLLGISLFPLLLTGGLLYLSVQHSVGQQAQNNLVSIATVQEHRIANIRAHNLERLTNFTNRLQLKNLLDQYNRTHILRDQVQLTANLDETQKSVPDIRRIAIMDPKGVVVAAIDRQLVGANFAGNELFELGRNQNETKLVDQGKGQDPVFYLSGPLIFGGRTVGVVGMEVEAEELLTIMRDHTGLGKTGEITLAQKLPDGRIAFLAPLRFDSNVPFQRIVTDQKLPIFDAVTKGKEATYTDTKDYRGESILAVSRYIQDSKWGMVVKIDRAEVFQSGTQLKSEFLLLAFISSVLVVFTAIALARRATQPILDIDEVAEEVSRGKLMDRVHDITNDEIGNLATTFNTMLDNLEELDKAKSDFVSLASHQLRTPATGVKALISLLLKDYDKDLTSKQRAYLQRAFESNERQLRVINDLLNVAMLESGKLRLTKSSTDIGQLVDGTVAEQQAILKSRQQKIHIVKPSQTIRAKIDDEKLRMVLDNLVSNASKYTPDGGSVTITLRQGEDTLSITVSDSGVGIAKKDIKKLFQKFSQIDNHLDHSGGGSAGLGLYLAKKIVELHGGHIEVVSEPNKGTSFTVELPNGAA